MTDFFTPDGEFGCEFCAGMGYEDYPSSRIPCRMSGHLAKHEQNVRQVMAHMNARRRNWSPEDGRCPYCKTNGECKHWRGDSWVKDGGGPFRKP